MKEIIVNGFAIRSHTSRGDGQGRMSYIVTITKSRLGNTMIFPSNRVLKRLARQYLECELTPEKQTMPSRWVNFTINPGISYERRVAFLAAVVAHIKTSDQS